MIGLSTSWIARSEGCSETRATHHLQPGCDRVNLIVLRDLIDLSRNDATASHHVHPLHHVRTDSRTRFDLSFGEPDRLGGLTTILAGVGPALAARPLVTADSC